ncbi:alkaline-phosphatase-like protein [Circinella umbellata]|nr:alkaline-phosphatase-like protein [Circinella umbellata]
MILTRALLAFFATAVTVTAAVVPSAEKPNILFIFTDDQDARMDSLSYMPNLKKHLIDQGTVYQNHYATVAVCCPSRVSLLRGQYAHNTNITDVSPPHGGYEKFNRLGLGDDYLPLWLKKAGYSNYYIVSNYNNPKPAGFDYQDQLVDPFTYTYNTAVFSRNGEQPVFYHNTYQTDVIHTKTLAALKAQRDKNDPFFLWVAPMAPHGQFKLSEKDREDIFSEPPISAARHADLFKDVKIPRRPNFNPANQTKTASYWKLLDQLTETEVDELDETYRSRLRALQAVDEMVGSLFEELESQGKLDNTYIIYSADNGYHLGQHRAYAGKTTNIEEDINVPLIVRGPGIAKGHISNVVSAHHDLAPTLLALAKGDEFVPDFVDGGVIPWTEELKRHPKPASAETFAVEFWWERLFNEYKSRLSAPTGTNTYKTLRVISEKHNLKYAVWCTGEHELFDLKRDPYELQNIYNSEEVKIQLIDRLDAVLSVLQTCSGASCRDPWRVIHPDNENIRTLSDALDKKYDVLYRRFRKITFKECLAYFSAANEEPNDLLLTESLEKNQQFFTVPPIYPYLVQEKQASFVQQESESCPHQLITKEKKNTQPIRASRTDALRLFSLVPQGAESDIGHYVPTEEELDELARPVPQELIDAHIDWVNHGFYSKFGN